MNKLNHAKLILQVLKSRGDEKKADHFSRFFKTEKGQYGEGDKFLGIIVPIVREIAKQYYRECSLADIEKLLNNPSHEVRLTALIIMTYQYPKLSENDKHTYYQFYLNHAEWINNWDLVDLSAPKIVGAHLLDNPDKRKVLDQLVVSQNLWRRRIAVLATFPLIKAGQFDEILRLAKILLNDKQDLMHKAVGWMLREVGKKDLSVLIGFLDQNAQVMPRTMLRYAIEKLPETQRQHYLKIKLQKN